MGMPPLPAGQASPAEYIRAESETPEEPVRPSCWIPMERLETTRAKKGAYGDGINGIWALYYAAACEEAKDGKDEQLTPEYLEKLHRHLELYRPGQFA